LKNNFYHELAKLQFGNRFGMILTLKFGTKEKAFGFLNSLRFVLKASNIVDARALVIHPASTIYLHSSKTEKYTSNQRLTRICKFPPLIDCD